MLEYPSNKIENCGSECDECSTGSNGGSFDDEKLPLSFWADRHQKRIEGILCETQSWRIRERMKTVSVALVLCLNIGVDPPDIVKIQPCARLECWIDPSSVSPQKAMELIGANLQKQYERWQPRARYKKFHDPTIEDVKKLCTSLRRNAKEERVLFHYNGHGVPRPTTNGEIWVFNKTYTQYIPLSIYDLQTWMGAPSIYVYDCSNAGIIVNWFHKFAEQHQQEFEQTLSSGNRQSPPNMQTMTYKNCIQLAACSANQILPMNSQLPADLFTSCLTTPIKIALKWYTMQRTSMLVPQINIDLIEKIPGQLNDRRTMLGELNWIFTAITDTIAWNTLPRNLFQKLFRQDLLVASLFRNFLLAERILRSYDCTPISSPPLPEGFRHPMWSAWDLAVDLALQQLPDILERDVPYKQLPFFEEQLTAFQVWLDRGTEIRSPPEQLPIVLQVLLSQVHRLRALELLGRFLDLGPWAVNLALGVGIFPYVLKLLQSSAKELRPVLVFIWAKILAVDSTCQVDLVKDHKYFLSVLQDPTVSKEHRTLSAFVLASIVHNFPLGQSNALQGSLVSICLVQIYDENWLLRQWLTICLGHLWQNFASARWSGVRDLAHEKLYLLLQDPIPEVRAAAVFALGTYMSSVTDRSEHANNIDRLIAMTMLNDIEEDMSPLVRLELIAALQWVVVFFASRFVSALEDSANDEAMSHMLDPMSGNKSNSPTGERDMKRVASSSSIHAISNRYTVRGTPLAFGSIYIKLWQGILRLGCDPYPKVAQNAQIVINYISKKAELKAKEATPGKWGSSLSLPPSPNTKSDYATSRCMYAKRIDFPVKDRPEPVYKLPARNYIIDRMKPRKNSIHEETDQTKYQNDMPPPTPISVETNFIPWSISFFARSRKTYNSLEEFEDCHSRGYRRRQLRFKRNEQIRRIAKEQQHRAISQQIDTKESWSRKTQYTPSIVKLLPYDKEIAVAYKDKVLVHDLTDNFAFSYTPNGPYTTTYDSDKKERNVSYDSEKKDRNFSYDLEKKDRNFSDYKMISATPTTTTATSLEFINAHYIPMVLVGYDNGVIRIWQNPSTPSESARLVTAWQGLPTGLWNKGGQVIVTTWHQKSQQLCVGGYSGSLRLWDVETELRVCDIPTDSDSAVRILTSSPNELIAAGYSDGSVRLFDKRASDAKVMTYREHYGTILGACLRDDCETLVTGCSRGKVKVFDIRRNSPVQSWVVHGWTTMAVHPAAEVIALGSQSILLYDLNGKLLTKLRDHEGFMGPKLGQASCLSFHAHKVTLAGGFIDNSVSVYGNIRNN